MHRAAIAILGVAVLASAAHADKATMIYKLKHNDVKDLHLKINGTFNKDNSGVKVQKKAGNVWNDVDFGNEAKAGPSWGGGNVNGNFAEVGDAGNQLKITMTRDRINGRWAGQLWETFTGDVGLPKNKQGQPLAPTTRFQQVSGGWKPLPNPTDFTLELRSDIGYEDSFAMLSIDSIHTGMDGALWDTSAWDDLGAHVGATLVDQASLTFSYGETFESEEEFNLLGSTVFGQAGEYALVTGQMMMGGEMVEFAYATDIAIVPTPGAAALLSLGGLILARRRR